MIVDAESGEAYLRPRPDVVAALQHPAWRARAAPGRVRQAARHPGLHPRRRQDHPADERRPRASTSTSLAETGAEGIGLFRTEFQFMVSEDLPRFNAQTALYTRVLEAAGDLPVTFRTLDLGGDKVLPYLEAEREDNPALGWRAIRMGLDRPALLRLQLRALIAAARGRAAAGDVPAGRQRRRVPRRPRPGRPRGGLGRSGAAARRRRRLDVGAMIEAPALIWHLDALLPMTDFVSVGTNDLMQYLFAADRGNPRVADRYDPLSPPALRALKTHPGGLRRDRHAGVGVRRDGRPAARSLRPDRARLRPAVHAAGRHRAGQADGAVLRPRGRPARRRSSAESRRRARCATKWRPWRESFMSQ